eukprot:scpid33891/ scgid20249/ 
MAIQRCCLAGDDVAAVRVVHCAADARLRYGHDKTAKEYGVMRLQRIYLRFRLSSAQSELLHVLSTAGPQHEHMDCARLGLTVRCCCSLCCHDVGLRSYYYNDYVVSSQGGVPLFALYVRVCCNVGVACASISLYLLLEPRIIHGTRKRRRKIGCYLHRRPLAVKVDYKNTLSRASEARVPLCSALEQSKAPLSLVYIHM